MTEETLGTALARSFTPVLLSFLVMGLSARLLSGFQMVTWILEDKGLDLGATTDIVLEVAAGVSIPTRVAAFLMIPVPFIAVLEGLSFGKSVRGTLNLYSRCTAHSLGFMVAWVVYVAGVSWLLYAEIFARRDEIHYSWSWFWTGMGAEVFVIAMSAIGVIVLTGTLRATREQWLPEAGGNPASVPS